MSDILSLDETCLKSIAVSVEDLYNIVLKMREAGEQIVELEICEPMPDIELGKHITFEAYGTAAGGAVDYNQIECITEAEFEQALWYDSDEEDIPEGYVKGKEITILIE